MASIDVQTPDLPPAGPAGGREPGGRRGRMWLGLGVVAVLVVLLVVGWLVASRTRSPSQAAADAAPPPASWVTVPVEFRVLSRTVVTRGDVRPDVATLVGVPASVEGEPVVTQVVVSAGDEVVEGSRVIEVSGRPVFVLQGDVPVYRTLRPGMSGGDVENLQAALVRLGLEPDTDGVYGAATKTAITAFYEQAGYQPIPSSTTEVADLAAAEQVVADAEQTVTAAQRGLNETTAGASGSAVAQAEATRNQADRAVEQAEATRSTQIALAQQALNLAVGERDRVAADPEVAPGALEQAQLAVNQAEAQLNDTRRSTSEAVQAAKEALWVAALSLNETIVAADASEAQEALDGAVAARDRAAASRDRLVATSGPTVPQGEIVFVPMLPARVQRTVTTLGSSGSEETLNGPGSSTSSLVELAGGRLVVDVTFRPSEQDLVRAGTHVELLDEQTNTRYPATVSDTSADAVTGPDGLVGYPATLAPDEALPANLAGANLRVTITAARTDSASLVVPLAAINSLADGTTTVQVLGDDGEPVTVMVEAGLSADGWVAILPTEHEALAEGDPVIVGR